MAMTEARWTDELEAGIENLDRQHKKYFDLLGDYLARAAMISSESDEISELAETLDFLKSYAAEHFSDEEQVMEEVDYPKIDEHRKEHQHFLRHVGELHYSMQEDGFSPSLAREVRYYTVEWFIEHIRLTDMEFVDYLKKASEKEPGLRPYIKRAFRKVFSGRG